ncbi:3D domain-containing protein [Marinicrinis lubricantis]|uniref:3D domain-containing protein n=1 Tax=Marinicrinis lubricantis TaxID=2086470 RepID=A0ABW1IM60_9BACL
MNLKKTAVRFLTAGVLFSALTVNTAFASNLAPYTIRENGETFWSISKKFNVPLQTVLDANSHLNPFNIYKGIKTNIPMVPGFTSERYSIPAAGSTFKIQNSPTLQANASLQNAKKLSLTATAYTASIEENKWGAIDYYGNPLKLGTVAVDPKMIPMGSKLYITGYDFDGLPEGGFYAEATDMGGSIKDNRIDIFVPVSRTKALTFGMQDVTVYILPE